MLTLFLLAAPIPSISALAPATDVTPYVQEACRMTGIPETVIWAVIGAESGGRSRAVSSAGAMGLMQLMPKTWSELRGQLNLGSDPFDPHDNIIAGTYYLRLLYDRRGWEGAFAAYNAGPGRFEAYRDLGKPLPAETRTYVARLLSTLGGTQSLTAVSAPSATPLVRSEARLFASPGFTSQPASASPSTRSPFVAISPDTKAQSE